MSLVLCEVLPERDVLFLQGERSSMINRRELSLHFSHSITATVSCLSTFFECVCVRQTWAD